MLACSLYTGYEKYGRMRIGKFAKEVKRAYKAVQEKHSIENEQATK